MGSQSLKYTQMTKTTISVAIATYNEENFIGSCLDSITNWADEIILVDGQSTDQTVAIAKKYKHLKIISTTNKTMFHLNKQLAIDHCTGNWILQLDADEVVSSQLKKEIQTILNQSIDSVSENGFWINRANYFLGKFLKKGGQYPDPTLRLYKNGTGKLPCLSVHEQAIVSGKVGRLKSDLLHFADNSFNRYLTRNSRYTSLMASDLVSPHFLDYFLIKPVWWFLKTYFRHKGYQDGFPGFVFSYFSALRFPTAYIKYYELQLKH